MVSRAFDVAAQVVDPELRVVTIAELGILRGVETEGDRVVVTITPTYSGCPAMDVIRADVAAALRADGWAEVDVVTRLDPAWSTDHVTEAGRAKLAAAGIAPPAAGGSAPRVPPEGPPAEGSAPRVPPEGPGAGLRPTLPVIALVPKAPVPACPRCGSAATDEVSRFGSTACKALWRCRECLEPFDHFKPL
jgi:ring-1,2-phenylacetyl-CoA epoxidase subunit PaaD